MLALLSPHLGRPGWSRKGQTNEREQLGLLGSSDKEVSIETISLTVSRPRLRDDSHSNKPSPEQASHRLKLS